jgi:hypothetical protein
MQVQPDDFNVLATIARYYLLTRDQIQSICFPDQSSGRATRRRLLRLREANYLTRHRVPVALPERNGAAPVYYVTKSGAEALASYFEDERFLATNTKHPRADRLSHWTAINQTRLLLERAIAAQSHVKLAGWFTEWETVNKDAADKDQFVLHTQLSEEPPLSCSPDAAFMLTVHEVSKVFYLEQDLGTSSPTQIAARKTKGYASMLQRELHRKHFPDTTLSRFSVLVVTNSSYRCRAIGEALRKRPNPEAWLLINQKELTVDSFLHSPIVYDTQAVLGPLVKPATPTDDSLSA